MSLQPSMLNAKTAANIENRFFLKRGNIQARSVTKDSNGAPIDSWTSRTGLSNIPCRMVPLTIKQKQLALMEYTNVEYRVQIMGYYTEITETDRIVIDTVAWDIVSVKPSSGDVMTILEVRRVKN